MALDVPVVWVSHAFGYGGDLMYYEQIFKAVAARIPTLRVVVRSDYPVSQYEGIPLWPILRQWSIPLRRRLPSGVSYVTELALPSPAFLSALLGTRSAVLVTIEFTPVSLLVQVFAMLTRKKLLLLIESDPSFRGAPSSRVVLAIKRFFARRADLVQTNSEAGARFIRDSLGVAEERVRVAPYLTSEIPHSKMDTSSASAFVSGRLRLLFVNSLTARKGLREFLTAWAQAPLQVRERFHLDVIGSGEEQAALQALVCDVGLGAQVCFHGRVAHRELGPYYRATDWVLCPTLGDYRSLAGFEAVNAGKPLLLSVYDGACSELLEDGHTGYKLDPRDAAQVISVLKRICSDDDQGRDWRPALEDLASRFSAAAIADNISSSVALLQGCR